MEARKKLPGIWRFGAAVMAALLFGAAERAAAEAELAPRRLDIVWQADLGAATGTGEPLRLRVLDDGRVIFGLGVPAPETATGNADRIVLVTLDAAGKTLNRVPVQGPKGDYTVIPLSNGDFLVRAETQRRQHAIELRRYRADGKLLFAQALPLGRDQVAMLLDGALRADGRLLAMASVGLGPNDTIIIAGFDAAGRRNWNYRGRIIGLGSEMYTRLYRVPPAAGRERFAILGDGQATDDERPYFVKLIVPDDPAATKAVPAVLGREGEMRCSAMTADGTAVVGTVPAEPTSLTIRWFDAARAPAGSYKFGRVDPCQIAVDREGRTLVWRGRQNLAVFGPKGAPLWRAELSDDTAAVTWTADRGIVAVHLAGDKTRVVRYAAVP